MVPTHDPQPRARPRPSLKIKIAAATGIHKIRHVVIIMQENRSFDSYFGTYPGADGIPRRACACPTRRTAAAWRPFHDPARRQLRRPARRRQRASPTSTAARWTASSPRPSRGSGCSSARPELQPVHRDQPRSRQPALHRRDGLPRRPRDPQLLGLRRELRAPGPHVRAQRVLEPAPAPVHGLRVVGLLHEPAGPVLVHERRSRTPTPTRPSGDHVRHRQRRPAPLRLDRHHLPAAPAATSAGATTCSRAPSPTARTTPR